MSVHTSLGPAGSPVARANFWGQGRHCLYIRNLLVVQLSGVLFWRGPFPFPYQSGGGRETTLALSKIGISVGRNS